MMDVSVRLAGEGRGGAGGVGAGGGEEKVVLHCCTVLPIFKCPTNWCRGRCICIYVYPCLPTYLLLFSGVMEQKVDHCD